MESFSNYYLSQTGGKKNNSLFLKNKKKTFRNKKNRKISKININKKSFRKNNQKK